MPNPRPELWRRPDTHASARARRPALAGAALLLLVLVAAPHSSAAQPYFLFTQPPTPPLLYGGNGNKIVVGPYNLLHLVYEVSSTIYYSTSINGLSWTTPTPISSGPATHPAIAVDGAGRVGVVWVAGGTDPGFVYGDLRYSYRPPGSTTWTTVGLGYLGAEPAIAAKGTSMHVTWTNAGHIRYTTFASLSPLSFPLETVDSGSCGNLGFRKPSIALVSNPGLPPIVRIAYLAATGVNPGCPGVLTSVGPRMRQRATATSWPVIYSNIPTTGSQIAPAMTELSMSATFSTGDTYLAWSDSLQGVPRTMLARGLPPFWSTIQLSATSRHVQVRAASVAPFPRMRLAWTAAGSGGDAFFGTSTFVDTATWDSWVAPTWTGATNLDLLGAGRPQALFWRRCVATPVPTLAQIGAYFEARNSINGRQLATDLKIAGPCPVVLPGTDVAVPNPAVSLATLGISGQPSPGTVVELEEVGVVTRISSTTATVTTPDARTVTVSWRSGSVAASSETTLTLTAPRADVTVTSADVPFSLVETGHLREYDGRMVP